MVIFWRGFGLIVPIIIALCAWIVSYWYDDTSMGANSYSAWVSFYSAIFLLLPGLAFLGGTDNEDGTKSRHDFMFIPVIFWALGMGAFSVYAFIERDSEPEASTISTTEAEDPEAEDEPAKVYRVINFVNSSSDSMTVVVRDEKGETERLGVGSKAWNSMELEVKKYTITSYNNRDEVVFKWKDKEITEPDANAGYSAQWIQMDGGEHIMIMMDITPLLADGFTKDDLSTVDWTKQIKATYDSKDIMTPGLPKDDKTGRLLEPGDDLPGNATGRQNVYALLNVPADQVLDNEFLVKRLGNQYFD